MTGCHSADPVRVPWVWRMTPTVPVPAFPMARDARRPLAPPPQYARLRQREPISRATLWNGRTVWLVTRYADVRVILGDDERFSAGPTRPGYPAVSPSQAAAEAGGAPSSSRAIPGARRRRRGAEA